MVLFGCYKLDLVNYFLLVSYPFAVLNFLKLICILAIVLESLRSWFLNLEAKIVFFFNIKYKIMK